MQDEKSRTRVVGLTEREASSTEELLSLVQQAKTARKTRATQTHEESSRSHMVLRLNLVSAPSPNGRSHGTLALVDCAGSERKEDSSHHDEQSRKDAGEINTSLFALKECFRALRTPAKGQLPPFRESFLTRVLSDSFVDERALVLAIGTVSPSSSDTEHSLCTLRALQQLQGAPRPSLEAREDVAAPPPKLKVQHPKAWSDAEVRAWLCEAANGRARGHVEKGLKKGTDGANLMRWNVQRFIQLCNGDGSVGERLYKELRQRVQASG